MIDDGLSSSLCQYNDNKLIIKVVHIDYISTQNHMLANMLVYKENHTVLKWWVNNKNFLVELSQ